jgi:hypothetical protein
MTRKEHPQNRPFSRSPSSKFVSASLPAIAGNHRENGGIKFKILKWRKQTIA